MLCPAPHEAVIRPRNWRVVVRKDAGALTQRTRFGTIRLLFPGTEKGMDSGSQTFQVGSFARVHLPPSLSAAGSISAGKWGSSPPSQAAQSSAQGSCSEFILGWGPGAGSRRGEDAQQSHQSMNLEHLRQPQSAQTRQH